jgi:transcription antitermination protein NusB
MDDKKVIKSARRRARELALQSIYAWLLTEYAVKQIAVDISQSDGFLKADKAHFDKLLSGVVTEHTALNELLLPCLDRPIQELSPIERAILLIGAYEFLHCRDIPYRVVINEAVELAKIFGGTDGYKFVNGVLDKLLPVLRPTEVQAAL